MSAPVREAVGRSQGAWTRPGVVELVRRGDGWRRGGSGRSSRCARAGRALASPVERPGSKGGGRVSVAGRRGTGGRATSSSCTGCVCRSALGAAAAATGVQPPAAQRGVAVVGRQMHGEGGRGRRDQGPRGRGRPASALMGDGGSVLAGVAAGGAVLAGGLVVLGRRGDAVGVAAGVVPADVVVGVGSNGGSCRPVCPSSSSCRRLACISAQSTWCSSSQSGQSTTMPLMPVGSRSVRNTSSSARSSRTPARSSIVSGGGRRDRRARSRGRRRRRTESRPPR